MNENLTEISEEEPLDTWYKEMGERTTPNIEDEPFVGLMEWCDYMEEYRERN